MSYSEEEIKEDFYKMPTKDFYLKYILCSHCWYFEKILNASPSDAIKISDEFKAIISTELNISFNNIAVVGSGKLGYSLAPKKLFFKFRGVGDDTSDLDIAIISSKMFQFYWDLFRKNYKLEYKAYYRYISRGIYRGYINESHLFKISGCRAEWSESSKNSKNLLYNTLYIKHPVTFRLYRSWEDFEEYHIQSIDKVKNEVN